jgi:hypothetical protein
VKGTIDAELEPGTMYRVSIDSDHTTCSNRLTAPMVASFRSEDWKPSLGAARLVALESGHARLPIS